MPEPSGRFNRLLVAPFTEGPRVRMGALWFFLTLAASTSGRWWTAALWSVAAAFAAAQTVGAWQLEYRAIGADDSDDDASWTTAPTLRWIAALAAATVPLAAGYGTGLAGVVLIGVAVCCGLGQLVGRSRGAGAVTIAVLLAAIGASSVVIAVRVDLWAGLFLILAVSLFDAGSYLMGAEAAGRWEGPIAGVIGALAVTFTMATIDPPPFDRPSAWLTGTLVALSCVLGQWTASAFLPRTTAAAPALRRLDAYIVAGPVFVACTWLLGS